MALVKRTTVSPDVSDFTKDWRRLQQQKQRMRGGVESRMLLNLAMYFGEHGTVQIRDGLQSRSLGKDEDMNRLNLIFNMIKKASRKKMGHIWRLRPDFAAVPNKNDPTAYDQADVVTDLSRALDFKCREKLKHWQRIWWLVLTGVVISHTPWIEESSKEPIPAYDPESGELLWRDNQSGQILPQSAVEHIIQTNPSIPPERFTIVQHLATVGDVGDEVISGLNFFIDASVPTIRDLPSDSACYILQIKTKDWVKDNFGSDISDMISSRPGDDLSIVKTRLLDKGPSLSNMNLRDLIPAVQGSRGNDDPPMALIATRYQPECADWPNGRRSIFVPGQCMLNDDGTPYSELPLVDIHYDAPTNSFWTGDFITDLIAPQKFLNKRMSQMGEAANASIHEILLLGGELSREDVPTDMPGHIEDGLDEDGKPRVIPLQHTQLPSWFLESIKEVSQFLLMAGSSDLTSQPQFPGQLRGPLSLPLMQELIDSEDAPFYEHLGEQLATIKQMRVNRVKQFYPPIRTLQYTGENQKDRVLVFHTEDILRAGTDFTITVDQATLMPELSAMRRARVTEDLSGPLAILYTDRRTGKLDPSKIAMAVKYTDRGTEDRETKYRTLAMHLIKRLWQGESLSVDQPNIPYPFWDHRVMLDEYENAMNTTEWLEASDIVKTEFTTQYEAHRQFLAAIQQSQMDSVQSQMMNGAVAQATQQAAAKAASTATDAALEQVHAQAGLTKATPAALSPLAPGGEGPPRQAAQQTPPQGPPQRRPANAGPGPIAGRPQRVQ